MENSTDVWLFPNVKVLEIFNGVYMQVKGFNINEIEVIYGWKGDYFKFENNQWFLQIKKLDQTYEWCNLPNRGIPVEIKKMYNKVNNVKS